MSTENTQDTKQPAIPPLPPAVGSARPTVVYFPDDIVERELITCWECDGDGIDPATGDTCWRCRGKGECLEP